MKRCVLMLLVLFVFPVSADVASDRGMVMKKSNHPVDVTLDRLESMVREKGFTVFARIDHAAGAAKTGQALRATEVLIFGNPKVGTALMTSRQSAGLDLPIRVAAWQDEDGQVWVAYNDPAWLARRHGIGDRGPVIGKMTGALGKFTDAATK